MIHRTLHAGGVTRKYFMTLRRFHAARDLIVAADRMSDRWAEGDESVRDDLWRNLHRRADELRDLLS